MSALDEVLDWAWTIRAEPHRGEVDQARREVVELRAPGAAERESIAEWLELKAGDYRRRGVELKRWNPHILEGWTDEAVKLEELAADIRAEEHRR